jgi:hypothetical protein
MRKTERSRQRKAKQVVQRAITQLLSLQLSAGMTRESLRPFAIECAAAAQSNFDLRVPVEKAADLHNIGSILRAWHKETRYLTPDGLPRALSMGGKLGLRSLAARFYPSGKFDELLDGLLKAGLLRRDDKQRFIPVASHAIVPHLSGEMYEHIADGVSRFVETVTSNLQARRSEDALFERSAKVRKVPRSDLPEFRRFVAQQASAFLVSIDDWMEARAANGRRSRCAKCTIGAFTFAFLEDLY